MEWVGGILSDAARSNLTEYLIVVAVVWHIIKKYVKEHFIAIEASLAKVASSLEKHLGRLSNVEDKVENLANRIDKLEKPD